MVARREPETRFTKVKFDGAKVRLEYERSRPDGGDPDEFGFSCADLPLPSLEEALQALVGDLLTICELDPKDATRIAIRGVTLTYAHDIRGACITGLKRLKTSNAPLVLNTPHLPESPYSPDNSAEPVLPDECHERLDVVVAEAHRYLAGERRQPSLLETPADEQKATDEHLAGLLNASSGVQQAVDRLQRLSDKDGTTMTISDPATGTELLRFAPKAKGKDKEPRR